MTIKAQHIESGEVFNFTADEWLKFQSTGEYQFLAINYTSEPPPIQVQAKPKKTSCSTCNKKRNV